MAREPVAGHEVEIVGDRPVDAQEPVGDLARAEAIVLVRIIQPAPRTPLDRRANAPEDADAGMLGGSALGGEPSEEDEASYASPTEWYCPRTIDQQSLHVAVGRTRKWCTSSHKCGNMTSRRYGRDQICSVVNHPVCVLVQRPYAARFGEDLGDSTVLRAESAGPLPMHRSGGARVT